MPIRRQRRNITPFVVSASDLAFIMLFFFIIVGNGTAKIDRIEMPYKQASREMDESTSPFRIEVYDQSRQSDTSRMAVIYQNEPPETAFVSIDNTALAESDAYKLVAERMADFIASHSVNSDTVRVDVFSSAHAYYGLVALAVAACNSLQYPCNLIYRANAGDNR